MTITSTPAAEKLTAALADNPGRTTAELALLAGIGKSTTGKLLAAWEAEGLAFRGGNKGAATWTSPASNAAALADGAVDLTQPDTGEEEPDREPTAEDERAWDAREEWIRDAGSVTSDEPGETAEVVTAATEAAQTALDADDQAALVEALLEMGVPATDPVDELAEQLRGLDPATATERLAQLAEANTKDSELAAAQAADADPEPEADEPETADEPAAEPVAVDAEPKERLRPGGLRTMVEEWLIANPDTEISPSRLGRILDRSSGAVANALATLTDAEVAVRTSDKPKRYQLAADA